MNTNWEWVVAEGERVLKELMFMDILLICFVD